jgi:hypothetical protein
MNTNYVASLLIPTPLRMLCNQHKSIKFKNLIYSLFDPFHSPTSNWVAELLSF